MLSMRRTFKKIRVRGLPLARARGSCSVSEEEMVGTTGFEPATSRTPSVRATRLRYVPTGKLTATGQRNHKANRGGNQHLQGITAVRAASRKCAAYPANRAAFCGSEAEPSPHLRGPRSRCLTPNFLHARAETGALRRW